MRRPPSATLSSSSAASDVYKRQDQIFPLKIIPGSDIKKTKALQIQKNANIHEVISAAGDHFSHKQLPIIAVQIAVETIIQRTTKKMVIHSIFGPVTILPLHKKTFFEK
eukprot:TRINITY_DN22072_c0_g1_i1.p3 TRINITY_DN22072_c0_g1~~TRINITY_DN22072_c0_g1_i1.p3  ORF type:complete len:109 (+),score=21.97 TRINITY_DN22072_c0_g1_i1:61-387(+)